MCKDEALQWLVNFHFVFLHHLDINFKTFKYCMNLFNRTLRNFHIR